MGSDFSIPLILADNTGVVQLSFFTLFSLAFTDALIVYSFVILLRFSIIFYIRIRQIGKFHQSVLYALIRLLASFWVLPLIWTWPSSFVENWAYWVSSIISVVLWSLLFDLILIIFRAVYSNHQKISEKLSILASIFTLVTSKVYQFILGGIPWVRGFFTPSSIVTLATALVAVYFTKTVGESANAILSRQTELLEAQVIPKFETRLEYNSKNQTANISVYNYGEPVKGIQMSLDFWIKLIQIQNDGTVWQQDFSITQPYEVERVNDVATGKIAQIDLSGFLSSFSRILQEAGKSSKKYKKRDLLFSLKSSVIIENYLSPFDYSGSDTTSPKNGVVELGKGLGH